MRLSRGNGGWHEVDGDLGLPGKLYARLREVDGRPRITELYIDGRGEPIQAAALRKLPVSMLEEWMSDMGGASSERPGPDLSRLAAHYATSWGAQTYSGEHCETCTAPLRGRHRGRALVNWVALSWYAQRSHLDGYEVPQVPMPRERASRERESPEPMLSAPESGLTDEFLSDVARAYSAAVQRREPPATALAALAGVERRTVESWIYKARKRGIMPPATKRGRIV